MDRTTESLASLQAPNSPLAELCRTGIPGFDPWKRPGDAWFDEEAAQLAIDFFQECLRHCEGQVAGQLFKLENWQKAIIGNLFGWKRKDAQGRIVRRFRELFLYVSRKNGKTPLAAGICNYVMFCDGEPGAQIYCAAASQDQAGALYRHAVEQVKQEPELMSRARIYRAMKSIVLKDDEATVFKVLSADADTKHGGNPHLILIDELHAQPNRNLVDTLTTGFASQNRKQPLCVYITTADYDRESICNEKYEYACKVRDGVIDDPAFLPVVFELKADDAWDDPANWIKANPNLGVSVSAEYLAREVAKAKETPSYENTFRRLHMNQRTRTDQKWLDVDAWDKGASPSIAELIEAVRGVPCCAGLDLSTTTDVAAFLLAFKLPENRIALLAWFWVPGDSAEKRERRDKVPYQTWARQGLIKLTPGNVQDYDQIKADINEIGKQFQVKEIAFDPWNATQLANQLAGDGFQMVQFRQGFVSMSEPSKELEKLVVAGQLLHGGNPVLRWMASNAVIKTDPAGNIKPDKAKSTERIDGIVAGVMAIGRITQQTTQDSVYETRGLITV